MTSIKDLEVLVRRQKKELYNTIFLKADPEECEVKQFPEVWSTFRGNMDLVKGIILPGFSKSAACIYYAIDGGEFPKHLHSSKEHIIVLSGIVTISHPQGSVEITTGESYDIEEGVAHSVLLQPNTVAIVVWTGVEMEQSCTLDVRPQNCKNKSLESITQEYEKVVALGEAGIDVSERLEKLKKTIEDTQGTICTIGRCGERCAYDLAHRS